MLGVLGSPRHNILSRKLSVEARVYNSSTWKVEEDCELEASVPYEVKPYLK